MIPVICVDGPSGSGKGTLSQRLSEALGFRLLDSGALYRVVGFAASQQGVAWDDEPAVTTVARSLSVEFVASTLGVRVLYLGSDVTDEVRSVLGAEGASAVAALPSVRDALLSRQRELAVAPGLVADGRDMGTVVFPTAALKIFLEASALARAQRRQSQLQLQDEDVSLPRLWRP
jgi:cytidylate kinase